MTQCRGKTKAGRRCFNSATEGSDFCSIHQSQVSFGEVLATGAGALIGNVFVPGIGGVVLGGLAGRSIRQLTIGKTFIKKRVFVSFDFDNDRSLKDLILGQAKLVDSPFEVIDHSLHEAAPEAHWEKKAKSAIEKSEILLVIVGSKTHRATGVLKEIAMAHNAGVKVAQIIGYKDRPYIPVQGAGRIYAWTWDNLKKILS